MTISTLPAAPLPNDTTSDFNTKAFALLAALSTFVTEANAQATTLNTLQSNVESINDNMNTVGVNAVNNAIAVANYKGPWTSLVGSLNIPSSVFHLGKIWALKQNVANVTVEVPGTSANWIDVMATFYPASGIPVSTGTGWSTPKAAPTGALVGTTDTQTLTNKTIQGLTEVSVALGSGTNIDLTQGNSFSKTISGTTTFTISNVPANGNLAVFFLILDNAGSYTVNFWSGVKNPGGTSQTFTTVGKDILGFLTIDGGATYNLVVRKDFR